MRPCIAPSRDDVAVVGRGRAGSECRIPRAVHRSRERWAGPSPRGHRVAERVLWHRSRAGNLSYQLHPSIGWRSLPDQHSTASRTAASQRLQVPRQCSDTHLTHEACLIRIYVLTIGKSVLQYLQMPWRGLDEDGVSLSSPRCPHGPPRVGPPPEKHKKSRNEPNLAGRMREWFVASIEGGIHVLCALCAPRWRLLPDQHPIAPWKAVSHRPPIPL